jgi:hypothetical protein
VSTPATDYVALLEAAARERNEARIRREKATSRLAEAAYEARRQGVPLRDIAAASGLTKQGLYDVARTHGYDLRRVQPKPK